MSIDKTAIYKYVQKYDKILKDLNILVTEQDKNNIYELLILLGELDDLYDKNDANSDNQTFENIKKKMNAFIPESSLKEKTLDLLFESMKEEANYKQYNSLEEYLEHSSITSGVPLIACYLGSICHINPEIWFSPRVNYFAYDIGSIIRMANDYLDSDNSQDRYLSEVKQLNSRIFFQNKLIFKLFITYKYFFHKISYFLYIKYLENKYNSAQELKAIKCYESVLELGLKAYFVDQEDCRD